MAGLLPLGWWLVLDGEQLGLPPLLAGLAFLPSALFAVVGNLISGPVTNWYGTRVPIVIGPSSNTSELSRSRSSAP